MLFTLLKKTTPGALLIDKIALKIPLFGTLLQKNAIARFARTLGTLLDNGVPMLQALQIAQETAGNRVLHTAISTIHDSIREGDAMMHPMEASHLFPPMVISMIAIGEETGQLSKMLLNVATIYEEEGDHTTAQLISMMEPLLIVFLALLVGSIVIALFLPLMTMISEME